VPELHAEGICAGCGVRRYRAETGVALWIGGEAYEPIGGVSFEMHSEQEGYATVRLHALPAVLTQAMILVVDNAQLAVYLRSVEPSWIGRTLEEKLRMPPDEVRLELRVLRVQPGSTNSPPSR
jgi:hypothetical protein